MELYIQIKDGKPFEHPILGDNFRDAFPYVDVDNLPALFAKFVRVEKPIVGPYEIYEGVTYEWIDGVVMDVHHVRPMTDEEKSAKQSKAKTFWAEHGYASWSFNEATCGFEPPVPYPTDGGVYHWDEEQLNWTV